jgi:hypothetical protein
MHISLSTVRSRRFRSGRLFQSALWASLTIVGVAGCQPVPGEIFGWDSTNSASGSAALAGGVPQAGMGAEGGASGNSSGAGNGLGGAGVKPVVPVVNPEVDPNIAFDWSPTVPGGTDACSGGILQGAFTCNPVDALISVPIEGSITIELIGPTESHTLEVSSGSLRSVGVGGTGFELQLRGKVACSGFGFMGSVEEASVNADQLGVLLAALWNLQTPAVVVQGWLAGQLSPRQLWGDITLLIGPNRCVGPFTARMQP